jgi:hypothetical protein
MIESRFGLLVAIARILHVPRLPVNQSRDRCGHLEQADSKRLVFWFAQRSREIKKRRSCCFTAFSKAQSDVTVTDSMVSVNASL